MPFIAAIAVLVIHRLESHPKRKPKEFGGGAHESGDVWSEHRPISSSGHGGLDD